MTYATSDIPVYVLYDRDISKDSDARVVLVRARGGANVARPAEFIASIVPDLGEPVRGREHLDDGLRNGAAVWEDGDCDVEVTAYRKEADWWQPGHDYLFVQIEARDIADLAGSPKGAPEVAQAGEGAPASAPTGPPAEGVVAAEAAAPLASAPADSPVTPSEVVVAPTRIAASYVPPRYPERAQRMSIAASVVLELQVKSDGSVGDVEVVKTTRKGMGFEEAAVDAVKQWRYHPATRGGQAEDAVITVRIDFK